MDSSEKKSTIEEKGEEFSFKDFFAICIKKWPWFLICMVITVGFGASYVYRQQPIYHRYEQILVTDQDSGSGGIGDIAGSLSSLGLFSKNTNIYNELISLKSPAVLYEVVDTLNLDMNYTKRDGFRTLSLYGSQLPYFAKLIDIHPQGAASFRFEIYPDGKIKLWKFVTYKDNKKIKFDNEIMMSPGQDICETPLGKISITPNPNYNGAPIEEPLELRVYKAPMQATVELYDKKLMGDLVNQDADVIELGIDDVSVERAVDVLTWVLNVYNQNWINDKNSMAIATSNFIDERLKVIQRELGEVDTEIAQYMSKTRNLDVTATAGGAIEKGARIDDQMIEVSNRLSMARYMKEYMSNNSNALSLLPVNIGIDNTGITTQIISYNDLLLARNNIANSSSEQNPLVTNYDNQLQDMRKAIALSLDNDISMLNTTLNNLKNEQKKVDTKMSDVPIETLPLLSEERQQKVKEALYLFLLEKREENQLSQKFSADNTRILTPPVGSLSPVAPRTQLILIISIVLGFAIPMIFIYLLESSYSKVRSKNDLQNLNIPFAGEIPQVGKKTNLKISVSKFGTKNNKDDKPPLSVVEEGKRDVVNEAFRVIRSNIDFMSGKGASTQAVMITSFNPGSGKSFITFNLGLSYAIKNKRVLIIDCDMRHGSASMYVGMPKTGITDYLTGNSSDWEKFVKSPGNPNLQVLPVGKMPPNPAELLEEDKFRILIDEAKEKYDLVLLDCPPVNIVVDTQIVGQYADRTLFVVRAGLLEKSALQELNEFYDEKKFRNMSIILNGTEAVHSRYYTYGNYQNLN